MEMKIMNSEKVTNQLSFDKTNDHKNPISEACKVFGKNMRKARKENGFTSEAFGRFMGISTAYVGLIERGERSPSLKVFLRICDFFGIGYDEMLSHKDSSNTMCKKSAIVRENHTKQVMKKRKLIASMLDSFDYDELGYMIEVIKSFKCYSQRTKKSSADSSLSGN